MASEAKFLPRNFQTEDPERSMAMHRKKANKELSGSAATHR